MLFNRGNKVGRLIVVVGPSGSGKDTLINWLKGQLSHDKRYMFVRRTVTRIADGKTEDHDSISFEQFADIESRGKFAVTWDAHGLRYGLPIGVLAHVKSGGMAIANGSRRALSDIKRAFPQLIIINLRVDRAVLANRLAERGRENAVQIKKRLDQMDLPLSGNLSVFDIDNSTNIDRAGVATLDLLERLDRKLTASLKL